MTCHHGEGCPPARCMVLALCRSEIRAAIARHGQSGWSHWTDKHAVSWGLEHGYLPPYTSDAPAMIDALAGQASHRWAAWFRAGGELHLLRSFAPFWDRNRMVSYPVTSDWSPLLVARDWLIKRGLEPEMWRQVHAFH